VSTRVGRRCSVCGDHRHDKRAHRNVRGRRLNPDWFRDKYGRPHPIAGSPGYEAAFVGMSRADKRYLRSGSDQPRGGYSQEARGRAGRVTAARAPTTTSRRRVPGLSSAAQEARFRPTPKRRHAW
jgi:hypothetical protein